MLFQHLPTEWRYALTFFAICQFLPILTFLALFLGLLLGTIEQSTAPELCDFNDAYIPATVSTLLNVSSALSTKDILSFWPRTGLESGSTEVEITANGFDFNDDYQCSFDDVQVLGVLISINRLVCRTPGT